MCISDATCVLVLSWSCGGGGGDGIFGGVCATAMSFVSGCVYVVCTRANNRICVYVCG